MILYAYFENRYGIKILSFMAFGYEGKRAL
jgi:hypothetical protein